MAELLDSRRVLVECYYCGRRFPELYRLTVDDVQREHLPALAFQTACADCLDRIRLASHLVPEQSSRKMFRNFAWMIPLFSLILFVIAIGISTARVNGFNQLGAASGWLGISDAVVGILFVWDRTRSRYGFTHDLRWTLNSKRVNLAVAITLAGIILAVVSTQLPR